MSSVYNVYTVIVESAHNCFRCAISGSPSFAHLRFLRTSCCSLASVSAFSTTHFASCVSRYLVAFRMLARALWLFICVFMLYAPANSIAVPKKGSRTRQANSIHPILGVRGLGVDTIHPRLEIRELGRNKDQLNVYLLGLQQLQSIGQCDKFSYYQIAGKLCHYRMQHVTR